MQNDKHNYLNDKENSFPLNAASYKTDLCYAFRDHGHCPKGSACTFAHGEKDLRKRFIHPLQGTVLCRSVAKGIKCSYGNKCTFSHDKAKLGCRQLGHSFTQSVQGSNSALLVSQEHAASTSIANPQSSMGIAFKAPIYPGYTIYGEYSPAFSSPNTASPLTSPTSSHQYSPLNGNGLNFLSWSPQSNGMADGGRRFYGLKSVSPSPNTYYGPGYNGLLDFLELEGKAGDHKYDGCSVIESDLWAPPKLA